MLLFSFYLIRFDAVSLVHFLAAAFVVFPAFPALKNHKIFAKDLNEKSYLQDL
jgi:hypothetical protein